MSLFQNSVLKTYLKQQDQEAVSKAYRKFTKYFHHPKTQENIRKIKEEGFQQKFLMELFVNVFGYTVNPDPNFNLSTEFKNLKGAKKADGAILITGKATAVIELKGTNTKDLESIRQQAFDYKSHHPTCVYVITSNFERLRFYINNSNEFEEFDLFTITESRFALLYLCLLKDNLLSGLPLKIKEESIAEEKEITKKFYRDYSLFKRELYRDLVRLNLKNEVFRAELNSDDQDRGKKNIKLSLFKKSQKLIDRFLFVFFAEDRDLLPSNSTVQILNKWQADVDFGDERPIYDLFKQYFHFLDTGRKGTSSRAEIFAYNGGLFKPDKVLDSLLISNDLLVQHCKTLAEYDFDSQVDVNILGHIFENSLNEIESVSAEIEGQEFDKQKTKRKSDGVFYTPKYITKYIVENTVGKLCTEKKIELGFQEAEYMPGRQTATKKKLLNILEEYREWLLAITICDPACGSGAFLNQALDFLINEHHYLDELQTKLLGGGFVFPNIENTVLEINIFGVDINEESVEIAKLSLWLRTAQPRRKLNDLSSNIKCGNSLIDSKAVAGNKAFSWPAEFPQVFTKGGFDVVIGNPPYVRAELLGDFRDFLQKQYEVFDPASDLFAYFYELGTNLIKPKIGLMGFISNTFDKTTAGQVLRKFLTDKASILDYVDFTEVQIFEGATTYPVIIVLNKTEPSENQFSFTKIPKSSQATIIDIEEHVSINVEQKSLEPQSWSFLAKESVNLFNRLAKLPTVRASYGKCYYGVKTALNEAFIVQNDWTLSEHVKKIYEGKELKKWNTPPANQKLIIFQSGFTKQEYGEEIEEEEAWSELSCDFPEICSYLKPFEEKGKKRYDKGEFWWELRNCAYYDLFEKPKIVFPNLQNSNKFCLDQNGVYINAPAVFLSSSSKTLLCIFNSKVVWEFLKSICVVRSGGYIEVKPQYFEQIPVPPLSNEEEFEVKADAIIKATSDLQSVISSLLNLLQSKVDLEKPSKKLQNWPSLDFKRFLGELKKAKVQLSLPEEAEWMSYFNAQKEKANTLQAEINRIDAAIDQIVYELYGLTEEEIKIVEGKK